VDSGSRSDEDIWEVAEEIYKRLKKVEGGCYTRYWDLVEHPVPAHSSRLVRDAAWKLLRGEGYIKRGARVPGGEEYFVTTGKPLSKPRKCIVRGCVNREGDGQMSGALCSPCYSMLTKGEIVQTTSFLGDMHEELKKLRHEEAVRAARKAREFHEGRPARNPPSGGAGETKARGADSISPERLSSGVGRLLIDAYDAAIELGEVRETSSTGGQKGRKPQRYALVPPEAEDVIARVYGWGAQKYSEDNWRKGYAWSLSYEALRRHINAFKAGEELDPQSGLPHLGHAAFHINTLLVYSGDLEKYGQFDDRPKL